MEFSGLVLVLSLVVCAQLAAADLPPELKGCQQSKPDFTKCVIGEFYKAVKLFKNGYKPFALLPLDPLRISKIQLLQGNGPISLNMTFTDLDIHNLSALKIVSGSTDWKTLTGKLHGENVKLVSKYEGSGKILALPLRGKGPSEILLKELDIDLKITFKPINKGGKKYLSLEAFTINLKPIASKIRLDNLFDGDKKLSENMNTFLNENAELLVQEMTPVINKALGEAIKSTINKVFTNIPADQIILK